MLNRLETTIRQRMTDDPATSYTARLAADPAADVIVLALEFPGAEASNGRVFIYDARKLRGR